MSRATTSSGNRTGSAGKAGRTRSRAAGARRSWRRALIWIAVPTLAAALCAAVFVQLAPQRYTAEVKVLLESGETAQPLDDGAVAGQVQAAMSRDIARQAIRSLNLVGREEFDPVAGEIGPLQRVLIGLGLVRNPLAGPPEERIFEAYSDRLLVTRVGQSRVLAFEFRSSDPDLAAAAANTVAELYIAALGAAQAEPARPASAALTAQIETLRARLGDAEAKLETFRARNGLLNTAGAPSLTGAQQTGELAGQLAQIRANRADLVGRAKVLRDLIKEGRAFEAADVANNVLIRRTVETRITLRAQLALELRTLLPGHPRIKELTAQGADLDAQIKTAAERILRTLEEDAKIASARIEGLQATVDGQSSVVGRGVAGDAESRALEREVRLQREQLDAARAQYRDTAAREGVLARPAEARIVARAAVPDEPSFPKKVPTLAAATLLALLFSCGAVAGRRFVAAAPVEPVSRVQPVQDEAPPAADPERLIYPEPLPPAADPAATEPEPLRAECATAAHPLLTAIEPPQADASAAIGDEPSRDERSWDERSWDETCEAEAPEPEIVEPASSEPEIREFEVRDVDAREQTIFEAEFVEVEVLAPETCVSETVVSEIVVSETHVSEIIVALPVEPHEAVAHADDDAIVADGSDPISSAVSAPVENAAGAIAAVESIDASEAEAALAVAAAYWEAAQAQPAAPPAASARPDAIEDGAYDFGQLIERLEAAPRQAGRTVLVVETMPRSPANFHQADRDAPRMVESLARALAARERTLRVDLNGRHSSQARPGLSDVVAADADFLDAIDRVPGTRMHAIGPGLGATDVLLDEPEGLAIALNAMAQAYAWVVCRIEAVPDAPVHALIAAVAASMDSVVLVSEADGSEDDLIALYSLAEEAGAGQILIAQGAAQGSAQGSAQEAAQGETARASAQASPQAAHAHPSKPEEMTLRLSAA